MRAYEAVVVLSSSLDEDAIVAFLDRVRGTIESSGGMVEGIDRWGRRRLAYEINGQTEGQYVLVRFAAEPKNGTKELAHLCRISEDVLRHLIVVREDADHKPAAESHAAAVVTAEAAPETVEEPKQDGE